MRGVVSLAAALAVPTTLSSGEAFPLRSLLVFITFVVILVTLVAQGLSLPWLVRRLRFNLVDDIAQRRHALELHLSAHAAQQASPEPDERHRRELVASQRMELLRLRDIGELSHELAREKEDELDLELARLDSRLQSRGH